MVEEVSRSKFCTCGCLGEDLINHDLFFFMFYFSFYFSHIFVSISKIGSVSDVIYILRKGGQRLIYSCTK